MSKEWKAVPLKCLFRPKLSSLQPTGLQNKLTGLLITRTVKRKITTLCEISGSHSDRYEDGCLLGCCGKQFCRN
jgi:hypothetical protein